MPAVQLVAVAVATVPGSNNDGAVHDLACAAWATFRPRGPEGTHGAICHDVGVVDGSARAALAPLVILDTNIWRSSQLLSDPSSAALLYTIESAGAKLGMPGVIEREVFKHGAAMGREAREQIEKHLRTIRALLGESPGIRLPSDEDFENAVDKRLHALEHLFLRVEFSTDIALRALDRVDLKRPPAHASQQYKDAAIWEHCVDLAADWDVHLVTADKAFYQGNSLQKGLEQRLLDELESSGRAVRIYPAMELLLAQLSNDVASSFDFNAAANAVHHAILERLRSSVEQDGWVLGDRVDARLEAFVTEKAGALSINFELSYSLSADGTARAASSTAEGQCMYTPASQEVYDVRLGAVRIFAEVDGELSERKHAFAHAHVALGGLPPVPHSIRTPLPGGNEFRALDGTDSGYATEPSELEATDNPR